MSVEQALEDLDMRLGYARTQLNYLVCQSFQRKLTPREVQTVSTHLAHVEREAAALRAAIEERQ